MKYYKNILSILLMSILAVFSSYGMDLFQSKIEDPNPPSEIQQPSDLPVFDIKKFTLPIPKKSRSTSKNLEGPSSQPQFDISSLEKSTIYSPETGFFPLSNQQPEVRQSFIDASQALIEYQLPSLLRYNQLSNPKKIVGSIKQNISIMEDFIKTQKPSDQKKRLSTLSRIEKDIEKNTEFLPETITNWIYLIESITDTTLNPNEMMTSTVQMDTLMQQRYMQALKPREPLKNIVDEKKEKEKRLLLQQPQQLLDYMNEKNWDKQTKVYVLQLLFWYAHQLPKSGDLQVQIIRTLHSIDAQAPDIAHQRGTIPYPIFSYPLEKLPEDAPQPLKNLFEQLKAELLENQQKNPKFAIQTYYEDIEKQKRLLSDESQMNPIIEKAKNFREKYGLIDKAPKSKQSLQQELEKRERYPKEKLTFMTMSPKTKFEDWELEKMITQAKTTQEQLDKLTQQNQEFVAARAEEKRDDQGIQAKFEASLLKNQQEMEALIEKQVKQLNQKINRDTNISVLELIKEELKLYKTYVAENNQELHNFINTSIENLDLLFTAPIPELTEEKRREQVAAALQMQAKAEVIAMEEQEEQRLLKSLPLPERIYRLQQKINTKMASLNEAIVNPANSEAINQLKESIKLLQSTIMEHLSSTVKTLEQDSHNTEKEIKEINHLKLKIATARTFIDFHNIQLQMTIGNKKEIKKSINNFLIEFIKIARILENPLVSLDMYDEFIIEYIIESDFFTKMTQLIPVDKNEAFESAYHIIRLTLYKPKASFFVRPPQEQPIISPASMPEEQNPPIVPVVPAPQPVGPQIPPAIPVVQPQGDIPLAQPQPAPAVQPVAQPQVQPAYERMEGFASIGKGIAYVFNTIISTIGAGLNWIASFFR